MKNQLISKTNTIRFLLGLLFVLAYSRPATAHVGSPGVIVQKQAGKYQVMVSVEPPDVVPGTAKITVFVEQGKATSIQARPIYFLSGDEGAPIHDELKALAGNRFEGEVWLMDSGSSSVELQLDGPDGKATLVAPLMSVATATRDMPTGTGTGLAALGVLLVVLMITIIGSSLSDGTLEPGQSMSALLRRKRWLGMGIATVVMGLILTGWRSWWTSTADDYRQYNLYKPLPIQASATLVDGQTRLRIQLDTTGYGKSWQKRRSFSFVIPDHGKLMHAFLVRMPGLDAFAHLHPERRDTVHFESNLPNLPGGRYLLYADVVYRSGFAETLTDTVDIPSVKVSAAQAAKRTPTDLDDSWSITEPMGVKSNAVGTPHLDDDMILCGKPSASAKLDDGTTMFWNDKPATVEAGKLYTLKFAVANEKGSPAALEPYLGMGGHAAILRSDGTVYIHLHPVGTYSMAAEESLVGRIADTSRIFRYPDPKQFRDSVDAYVTHLSQLPEAEKNKQLQTAMPGMSHPMKVANMVEFPYAFPRSGHYRIWVQVKRNGKVLTGVFDTQVKESLL
ncbi:hypothetical protein [Tellurirhabdus bombi]|uniref:hypothetical protein n=1 Tax=Tellurirhabdus bombi TaxID=2907205 RepID=UPI001F25029E|nr:hypothetical protein [Tellurirhabdus bombi]